MDKLFNKVKALFEKIKQIKHIKLIAGIAAGVLVLAIALVILLLGMQGPSLTPAQQYIKLETDLLHKLVDSIPEQTGDSAAVSNIDILPSDALLSLLGMEDMDWAKNLSVTLDAKQKDGLQETLWGFKVNGKQLFDATTITDPIAGVTYLVVPSVSEHFLKIDEAAAGNTDSSEIVDSATAITDFLSMLNISEMDVAKTLLNKYIDVFFSHMTEVDKHSELIYVGEKTQTVDVYDNYITEKVFTDAFRAVLKEARSDIALKSVFPEDADYEYVIDQMLAGLNSEPANDRRDAIVLKLYVSSEGHIVGRSILLPETDVSFQDISCITVNDGNTTAVKIRYSSMDMAYEFMLDGEGKGTLSMVQPDQTVILANLIYALEENTGFCEITLSDFFQNLLFQSDDMDPSLKITWEKSGTLAFTLRMSSEDLVTIRTSASSKEGPHSDITIPEASLDYSVQEELDQYMQSIDWSTVRANMLDAGIPKNMIDFLLGKE